MQEKNNASLVMGILSIILAFVFPFLGILGLVLASSNQRESGLDYTTEKILSIVGIVLSVVMFIVIISQLSGIN